MWSVWLALVACQEPFGADRHDLRGFRIAALTAHTSGDRVFPRVAVVVDGAPYADGDVSLEWRWVTNPGDGAEPVGGPAATGPAPELIRRTDRLALRAIRGDEVRVAELQLGDEVAVSAGSTVMDAALGELTDVSRDARSGWSPLPGGVVPTDGFARVTLDGDVSDGVLGRFMGTSGTWLELDGRTADWTPGELVLDDGEIVTRDPGEPGVTTALVLALDGPRAGFTALDLIVGEDVPGVWTGGRLLPSDGSASGRLQGTLRRDDGAPSGLRLADVVPAGPDATWDPESAGCVGVSGPFDPTWLLELRCDRAALDGVRVVVDAR